MNNSTLDSTLLEKFIAIKEEKENTLKKFTSEEIGLSIDLTILNEELKDVEYAIEALRIVDIREKVKRLKDVCESTTSASLYDALSHYNGY